MQNVVTTESLQAFKKTPQKNPANPHTKKANKQTKKPKPTNHTNGKIHTRDTKTYLFK